MGVDNELTLGLFTWKVLLAYLAESARRAVRPKD